MFISFFKKKIKKNVKLEYANRRKDDVSKLICDPNKVKKSLKWSAKNSNIKKIINNEIKWIKKFMRMGLKRTFETIYSQPIKNWSKLNHERYLKNE